MSLNWLLLSGLVPLFLFAAWRMFRRSRRDGFVFAPASRRLKGTPSGLRHKIAAVSPYLILIGLLLLIVSAGRPRKTTAKTDRNVDALAIEMAVDISGSMQALDLSVRTPAGEKIQTRLDVVKETFAEFVQARPDDLIGLVTFGGYAATRSPLTADHAALLQTLKGVEIPTGKIDNQGRPVSDEELLTAIGDGLSTALARVADAEPKTKIVVLLSDGESNTGVITPDKAAEAAKKLGIKVYTIGVGTTGAAPFRTRDIFGRETIAQAEVRIDEAQLKQIADLTGGSYYNVRSPDALKDALAQISQLETTRVRREIYLHHDEHFLPWFAAGLAFFLLGITLNMLLLRRVA